MYTLTNCTPHVMFLARELVPDPLFTLRGRGQYSVIDGLAVIALAPSGFTLPALAVATGPDLAARVTYEATDKMREELHDLRRSRSPPDAPSRSRGSRPTPTACRRRIPRRHRRRHRRR